MADTPRARARVETTEQIKAIARRQLATEGPNLSLRAVARELGVVSSAVYRYFASRDELLTALILDAYNAMGEAVERAEAAVPRRELVARWATVWRVTREWSLARPAEYALVYGSPIPGYAAPQDTVAAAQRPLDVAMTVLRDGIERGVLEPPTDRLPRPVRSDVETIATFPGIEGIPPTLLARAMTMWAMLFGTISFELFGRYTNGVTDLDTYFEHQVKMSTRYLGLS
ncbi:transcriptional regulator, TetR family [Jatrophihabitans endophyticus]|uniref:Transcriptional regulator, TetR family n=1 Tax=Jatrophihabitans endophyticus TaxID=1206085 RepID=A0A1M5PMV4_9ACTN|nr:TetR/AcrR family transcriptional regulator [Jatrophihabitans endophyticus]SHH03125.1 transcriptional regulator, TetR family [Jatrophihabitans endophyticus]